MAESVPCSICGKSCQVASDRVDEVEATREASIIGAARTLGLLELVNEWDRACSDMRALFLDDPTKAQTEKARARIVDAEVAIWTFRAGFAELDFLDRRRRREA